MKSLIKKISIATLVITVLYSCTDDYFEFDDISTQDWRPELALPLINSSLTLADIVTNNDTNGVIQKGANDILQIVYDGRVFSTQGAAIISLPDQPFEERFNSPIALPSTGGPPVTRSFSTILNFDNGGNDVEVDSILLKAGDLVLTVENEFEHNLEVVAKFLSIKNSNGESLELNYNIPPFTGGQVVSRSEIQNLTGYTIDMTNRGTTVNEIPVQFDVTFNLVNGKSSVSTDELIFSGLLRNLDFKEFNGYVGNISLPLDQDTINVNLFKNFLDAKFFLSNPLLDITVLNSFGLPVDLNFNQLFAVNSKESPANKQIELPPSSIPLALAYPKGLGQEDTLLRLDTLSSNIDEIISFLLEKLVYDATANFNPTADKSIRNFVTDTSSIGLDVFLRIPFSGYATGLTVQDTIDFEFENSDDIDQGLVRVRVNNGFPLDGELQVLFLDSAYQTLEVLFVDDLGVPTPKKIIEAAPTDVVGNVISSVPTVTDGELDSKRLANLKKSKYALVRATMDSRNANNNEIVSFKEGYRLDIAVGIKAKFLID